MSSTSLKCFWLKLVWLGSMIPSAFLHQRYEVLVIIRVDWWDLFFSIVTFFQNLLFGTKKQLLSRQKVRSCLAASLQALKREQNDHTTKEDGEGSLESGLCWIECRLHQRHACFYSRVGYKFKSHEILWTPIMNLKNQQFICWETKVEKIYPMCSFVKSGTSTY